MNPRRAEELFDDFIDDIYPEIKVGCHKYSVSSVLKKVDKIAYRESFLDWVDSYCNPENKEDQQYKLANESDTWIDYETFLVLLD